LGVACAHCQAGLVLLYECEIPERGREVRAFGKRDGNALHCIGNGEHTISKQTERLNCDAKRDVKTIPRVVQGKTQLVLHVPLVR
jgi:hypothetical protein